jgi:hypothetical protein
MRARLVIFALIFAAGAALAQIAKPLHFISTAGTNSTSVQGVPGEVTSLTIANPNCCQVGWVKLYDKATAPTCGSDTPVHTFMAATSANLPPSINVPLKFLNGIGFCITGAGADNDGSNAPANIVVDIGVK